MRTEAESVLHRLAEATDLPTLPVVVEEGLRLLRDERTGLREVGDLISTDPVLGARVLRMANSAVFGLRTRVKTIQDGVRYMGTNQVRNLLLSSSVVDTFSKKGLNLKPYWEHAFGCAYVASTMGKLLRAGNPDDAYLGGLFHDLGRILLVVRYTAKYAEVLKAVREAGKPILQAEREVFGATHAEIGSFVAQKWGFPERAVMVVKHHHNPAACRGYEADAAIVQLADYLCWSRGLIDVAEDLQPVDIQDEACWAILTEKAGRGEALDPHGLLHEADTMVHTARLLVEAVYER